MEHLPEEIDLTLGRLFSTEWNDKFDTVRRYSHYTVSSGEFYDLAGGRSVMLDEIMFNITPHPWSDTIFMKDAWTNEEQLNVWFNNYLKYFGELPELSPGEIAFSELHYMAMYDGRKCEQCGNDIDLLTKSAYHGMCNVCTEHHDYSRNGFFAEDTSDFFPLE